MRVEPRTSPSTVPAPRPAEPAQGRFSSVLRADGRTPMSQQAAFGHLSEAWAKVTGTPPTTEAVSVLWAQWAMETGRGMSMYGFNFGGIKGAGPSGKSLSLRTHEGHGATERAIRDRFRAYDSPAEGAEDYVRLLRDRYPEALEAARFGDARAFVQEIHRKGYFTGSKRDYVRAVCSLSAEARGERGLPRVSAESARAAVDALGVAQRLRADGVDMDRTEATAPPLQHRLPRLYA